MPDGPNLLERYRLMVTMRLFEEACAEGIPTGELRGELHLADGQEAVAAGMIGALRPDDWMVSTHRPHQHAIVKGVPLQAMMDEIYERATGLCRGKGGHMHLFDLEHRFSATGIVGSSLPVALGHAYASRLEEADYIAVGITGDGGTNVGQFHETMNMAAIWQLPLVVLVENNHYAMSVPAAEVISGPGIAERAAAYGAWGRRVDGTDVEIVADAFRDAADHARSGKGPALLEAMCFRVPRTLRGRHRPLPEVRREATDARGGRPSFDCPSTAFGTRRGRRAYTRADGGGTPRGDPGYPPQCAEGSSARCRGGVEGCICGGSSMSMNQDEAPAAPRVNLSKLIAQTIGTEMERDSKIRVPRGGYRLLGWALRLQPRPVQAVRRVAGAGHTDLRDRVHGDGGRLVDERVAAPRRDHDGRFHWGVPRADL